MKMYLGKATIVYSTDGLDGFLKIIQVVTPVFFYMDDETFVKLRFFL